MLDEIAKSYTYLGLGFGKIDPDYVDAYHGPADLRTKAEASSLTLKQIIAQADELLDKITAIDNLSNDMDIARQKYLAKQLLALKTRAELLNGRELSFDDETQLIYDVTVPQYNFDKVTEISREFDIMFPDNEGDLQGKIDQFRSQFIIPSGKIEAVFERAINEARERTNKRIELPSNENFVVSYVRDKPWSGYNWYQGDANSLIEINIDLPIYIDRVIDLASHEGYPGHHTYHSLTEKHLYKGRGWIEWSINPLFGPTGLIGEGSANFGIDVAFPGSERIKFEKEVLMPLAGLPSDDLDDYYKLNHLRQEIKYFTLQLGRMRINNEISDEEYIQKYQEVAFASEKFATQSLRFLTKYRSYIINYVIGLDLVTDYINKMGGTDDNPDKRWELYIEMLSKPTLPSDLIL